MEAELIERIRIQASLAEKALLALVAINTAGVFAEPAARSVWSAGLIFALLAFMGAFLSQHHFSLACQHEIAGNDAAERRHVIIGNRWYMGGLVMAIASMVAIAIAL